MRRVALVLMVVAACSRDGGLLIDVTPTDSSVDQVRLFVGVGNTTDHATLGLPFGAVTANPDTRLAFPDVAYWTRDPENELDTKAVSQNETVRFVLVRSDTDTIPALLAVGYSQGRIVQVATRFGTPLPKTKYALYTMKLEAPVDDLANSAALNAGAWDSDQTLRVQDRACVGVFEQNAPYPRSLIVSADDQDCDGLTNDDPRECTPDIYNGKRAATVEEAGCLIADPATQGCTLGGPPCIDQVANRDLDACVATAYCVPSTVCSACGADLACAKDITPLDQARRPAMYGCPIASTGGNVCTNDVVLDSVPSGGLSCTSVVIGDKTHTFSKQLDLGAFAIVPSVDHNCDVTLKLSGPTPGGALPEVGAMIAVTFENGRGIAIPVVLKFPPNGGGGGNPCSGGPVQCTADPQLAQQDLTACATAGSSPVPVQGLPDGARSPTLTADMLDIWFMLNGHILHSSRASLAGTWGTPTSVPQLESVINAVTVSTPHVSQNGTVMFLAVGGVMNTGTDIYRADRATRADQWLTPVLVPSLSSLDSETGGAVDAQEGSIAFDRAEGSTPFAIRTAINQGGTWTNITTQTSLVSIGDQLNPVLSDNGLKVYYGSGTATAHDIYAATRNGLTQQFSSPQPVPFVNTASDEVDPWVAPDGKTMYFATDRNGVYRIYVAHF